MCKPVFTQNSISMWTWPESDLRAKTSHHDEIFTCHICMNVSILVIVVVDGTNIAA